jgi:hypothetical protein
MLVVERPVAEVGTLWLIFAREELFGQGRALIG